MGEDGGEGAGDADEFALDAHDVVDVLVDGGGFFAHGGEGGRVGVDVGEFGRELSAGDGASGVFAGHGAAGAVGAGVKSIGEALAGDVEGGGGHGARDEAGEVRGCGHRAFAVDEVIGGEVGLGADVVVIGVDVGVIEWLRVDDRMERGGCGGEDGAAVGGGVIACPLDVGEVCGALGCVGVKAEEAEAGAAGALDVGGADGLAEGARAGVDHEPELVGLVALDFEEVVSRAEGGEVDGAFVSREALEGVE